MPDFIPGFLKDARYYAPIATSIGIIISTSLWLLNQRKKAISYLVLQNTPLLNTHWLNPRKLSIRYENMDISESNILLIKVVNSGHLPVNMSDYAGPISISVTGGAIILNCRVIECNPADLTDRFSQNSDSQIPIESGSIIDKAEKSKILLRPIMLNSGDYVILQLLLDGPANRIYVSGHIHGISTISPLRENPLLIYGLMVVGFLIMAGSVLVLEPHYLYTWSFIDILPYIFAFFFGYILLYSGRYLDKKSSGAYGFSEHI